ncbi:MAG: phosphotransferase family protein [Hyphomonadaceae bacterium]
MAEAGLEPPFAQALGALVARLDLGTLSNLHRLSGGASQETWAFEAGGKRMILRRAPPDGGITGQAIGLEKEAALMMLARDAGVPSPRVRAVLKPEDGVGRGFIMDFVDGETLGGRIVKAAEAAGTGAALARQCGDILARIHAIPMNKCPELPVRTAQEMLADFRQILAMEDRPRPVFELAFRWLDQRIPERPEITLVHSDFRNGNLIIGPDGVRAVLDWEIARFGDPMADLGWLGTACWRFGGEKPVGGFGLHEDLFAGYEAAGGAKIDPERVRFWEVLGSLRWGVMCTMSAVRFRSGPSEVDRPMIARRASENELDLMQLIAGY